ncbi:MAG: 3-dehydroquinate synthase [Sedimentibacter sp.]|uniref:3-dehydroquinate synthase n=1 Tax=Sedimentibacter sp. TaxID=1960295 RepID=UPI002981F113|nr:3-dehydroquinate synthase [Sedimentibacter sp.]MDW5299717.1 3-dehydroquinate synthase [Sedimentibacter sp.]
MKKLNINLDKNKYDILIENGIINNAGYKISNFYQESDIAVITDENVYKLYGEALKESLVKYDFKVNFIIVKPGEASKSLGTLKNVYTSLTDYGVTRGGLIIALGGGVVGDLAGFAASTYLRGIDYVQIPTTLLAQIDSSIGGKVAVNLQEGKNLVGSFYHPKIVLIDPSALNSLPDKFIKDGLGEAVKYGCIKDKGLFNILNAIKSKEELLENIEDIIFKCCSIKKEAVEADEKDKGMRMLLNFGHTLGHAIEKYYNYESYSHGEAISIGMYHITEKSEELGYTKKGTAEEIKNILTNLNMNYELPDMSMNVIRKSVNLDKKNISGLINLILLREIGNAYIEKVPVENIEKFI